jgi:hypothetical protein
MKGENTMINGKSIFSWNIPAVGKGDPEAFVKFLLENNFEGICLKAANGPYVQKISRWSPWPRWGENIRTELVEALKGAGIKVYLWHFVYGRDPAGELAIALSQTARFEPDGYIWDVETAFDSKANAIGSARYLTRGFKKFYPQLEQALCWWALPLSPKGGEWHPIKVANAFQETVDLAMPMMYWQGKGELAAVSYLHRSLNIYSKFWKKPIVPVGRAYNGDGGYGDAGGITAFAREVISLSEGVAKIPGISWWVTDKAVKNPAWLTALRHTETFDTVDPIKLTPEEMLDRLVEAHPELFPELN